jgi:hypothetical protein
MRLLIACLMSFAWPALAQREYSGPRPPKPDIPFLLHASNLIETETSQAREETRKDVVANIVEGASSPIKTPLAEPIFLIESQKVLPEKLELYLMAVVKGSREVVIPTNPKKMKDAQRPVRMSVNKLAPGLFRIEAAQELEIGEYCMSPSGSSQVFCFQVY